MLIQGAFESSPQSYEVSTVDKLQDAYLLCTEQSYDLIICNFQLPDGEGIELLSSEHIKDVCPVIIITDHGDERIAVDVIKAGALDYVIKTETSMANMPVLAKRVLREWRLVNERKQMESALHQSEARLSRFFSAASEGIFFHEQGVILDVNPAVEEIFGHKVEDIVGKNIFDFIAPESRKYAMQSMVNSVETPYELRGLKSNGELVPVEVRAKSINYGGKELRVVAIRDISLLKKAAEALQKSNQQVRLLLDSTAEGIYGLDKQGRCTFSNRACIELLGYDDFTECTGKEMHALSHHSYADGTPYPITSCHIHKAINEGVDVHRDDEVLWRKDGTSFDAEYWSHPVRQDNEVVGAVVTFIDITDRKKAETALHEAHENLELKVHERTRELAAANDKLLQLDQLKSMFIASMSHELRTPLNSIIGFTGVMLEGMTGELSEVQRDQLSRVYSAATHLLSLITDVIDISKIEAGKIDYYEEQVVIDALVHDAVEQLSDQMKNKGLKLEVIVPSGLVIPTDKRRLMQCLLNLISNAVKYTTEGGIKIEIHDFAEEVIFKVSDTGIGISEVDLERLFMPFERFDSGLRTITPGTGLGLYLTRKLVTEILGGRVEAVSELGGGSTFTITLPK